MSLVEREILIMDRYNGEIFFRNGANTTFNERV